VSHLRPYQLVWMGILAVLVTAAFWFILRALGTVNLLWSTVSITTSFVAAFLTLCRSPWYALGYAANDLVLIVLWVLAFTQDMSYLPMVVCFIMFFANDVYGFINWRRMQIRQAVS